MFSQCCKGKPPLHGSRHLPHVLEAELLWLDLCHMQSGVKTTMNLLTSCGSDFCLDPLDCPHREKVLFMPPLIYRMNRGSLVMGCVRLTNTPLYMCTSLFLVLPMACGGFNFSGRKDKASENLLEFRVRQLVLHPKIFFLFQIMGSWAIQNSQSHRSTISEMSIHSV